jgi:hypothetical protein
MWRKSFYSVFAFLAFVIIVGAYASTFPQEKAEANAPATLVPSKTPAVPDAVKVKILQAQLAQEKAARQYQQLQAQEQQLKDAWQVAQVALKAAEDQAYAKVDKKDWVLDETNGDVRFAPAPKAEAAKPKEPPSPPVKP